MEPAQHSGAISVQRAAARIWHMTCCSKGEVAIMNFQTRDMNDTTACR
jgi:hypothetical protein